MKWSEKVNQWKNGIPQIYPKNIKKKFIYETYVCDRNLENQYKERFIENNELEKRKEQNYNSFEKYINVSKNKYVTSFYNISKDTMLIVPIPKQNKSYSTMKDFIDNASETQQKEFWKKVAIELNKMLKSYDKIYVNTHGLAVNYFHLRLDTSPKYYITKEFI